MTEHPRIPAIERHLIRDPPPSMQLPGLPVGSAPSATPESPAAPATPAPPPPPPPPQVTRAGRFPSMSSSSIGVNSAHIIVTEDVPEPPSGHLVSVLMYFNSQIAGPATRGVRLIHEGESHQIWIHHP